MSDRTITGKLRDYAELMRMHRPIGTLLLLWPTLWALWDAGHGRPRAWTLFAFITGVFLMRSAGCIINDYADRDIDPHVQRTRDRPLAAGRITPAEALWLFVGLCLAAFCLVLTLNPLTVGLALIAALLAVIYPFMKRVTHLPQLVLGLAFSWGIPMAYAAETGNVGPSAWLLVAVNLSWVVAYDTMYAMVDRDDDLRIGAKSTAILFGRHDRPAVALFQIIALALLWVMGIMRDANAYYFAAVLLAALLAGYQQWLIRNRDRDACFQAFLNNAWFGAAVYAGFVFSYL